MYTMLVLLMALAFMTMGLYTMCAPTKALALFFEMRGPEGRNEVRAVYGGFGLAIAGLLALAAINVGELRPGAVFAVAAALAGMASGRLVARVFEPTSSFYPVWLYFWLEIVGASVLITAALTPK